ncbi:MAG: hypothetical protein AAF599_04940, partial [Bacteroidota bacterium]
FTILCEVIFSLCKAKNVGDAGHRRGFSTQQKGKRTSRKCKFIIEPFLNGSLILNKSPTHSQWLFIKI